MSIRDGVVYFTNIPDFRIYKASQGTCEAISPSKSDARSLTLLELTSPQYGLIGISGTWTSIPA